MEPRSRHLLDRLLEAAIVIALSGYLIKLGVGYVLSVKWALLAIAGIILLAVAGIRLYRYHRHTNNWRDGDEGF